MNSTEILLRGPEELGREKQVVEETVEDIGNAVGEDIHARQVKASEFEECEDFHETYREIDGPREFETEFERQQGGLRADNMSSVLLLQPYTEEFRNTPVMYLTDRPLYAENRDTEETRHVYGLTQPSHHRPAAVLSTFAFTEMNEELHDEMLETLTYHEGGHLMNEENPDREYRDESEFGGGHCTNEDVMTGKGIWEDTENRYENELYCEACTEEIREGIENL